MKKNVNFKCRYCGSNELGYQKFVKCTIPVSLQENGQTEYSQSKIDEDDYLWTGNGVCCVNCGHFIEFCGCRIETEQDLLDYLTIDPADREQQEKEHEEIITAQIDAQEQQVTESWEEFAETDLLRS